jgi:hypothetical protein
MGNEHDLDGIGGAFLLVDFLTVVLVVLALAFAVLVVTAALGLTSFSVLALFRRKDRRDREAAEDGGIDDLF